MKNLLTKTLFIPLLLSVAIPFGVQAGELTSKQKLVAIELTSKQKLVLILTLVDDWLGGKFSNFAYRGGKKLIEVWDNSAVLRKVAVPVMAAIGGTVVGAADAKLSSSQAIGLVKLVAFCYSVSKFDQNFQQ